MGAYAAVFRARFQTLLQYRAAAAAGVGTQLFWGFIRIMILAGFYASSSAAQPMSLEQAIGYVWLGQALFMLVPWRAEPESDALVRTGNVAYELLRPVDLYHLWLTRSLAWRTAPTLLRAAPLLVLALLFFGLAPPPSLPSAGAFLLSLGGAVLLSAALTTLISISLMWTISGRGLAIILNVSAITFSGLLVPIPLCPDWAVPVLEFLPYRGVMDTPLGLWLGHIPASELGPAILHQLVWSGLLIAFGRWLIAQGRRRLVIQGG